MNKFSALKTDTTTGLIISSIITYISAQKCPDLRTDLSSELYQHAVSYNSNTKTFNLEFDWDGKTKIIYDPSTESSCSGINNKDNSICKLACSDGKNSPVIKGLPRAVFGRRRRPNTSKHHIFKCKCSNDDIGREICFWEIQERNFMNPMSCDPVGSGIKYGRRRSTVKTVPWEKTVRRGRRRTKEFDERHLGWWEEALRIQSDKKTKNIIFQTYFRIIFSTYFFMKDRRANFFKL